MFSHLSQTKNLQIFRTTMRTGFRNNLSKYRVDTAVWMHHLDASKTAGEEARR